MRLHPSCWTSNGWFCDDALHTYGVWLMCATRLCISKIYTFLFVWFINNFGILVSSTRIWLRLCKVMILMMTNSTHNRSFLFCPFVCFCFCVSHCYRCADARNQHWQTVWRISHTRKHSSFNRIVSSLNQSCFFVVERISIDWCSTFRCVTFFHHFP